MIDVSELIHDPDFAQTITVTRSRGEWSQGEFTTTSQTLTLTGIVIPDTKEMAQTPQGDLIQGDIEIYTHEKLYTTQLRESITDREYISDEVTWRGANYKILKPKDRRDNGYFFSVATRKMGA